MADIFKKLQRYIDSKYRKPEEEKRNIIKSRVGPKRTILEDDKYKVEGSKLIDSDDFKKGKEDIESQIDESIMKAAIDKARMHEDDDEEFEKYMRRVKALRQSKK